MAGFCIDEGMAVAVARLLRDRGHQAFAIEERNLKGSSDDIVLLTAARAECAIVTHNIKDFVLLHKAWLHWEMPFEHAGIVAIPQHYDLLAGPISDFLDNLPATSATLKNSMLQLHRDHDSGVHTWEVLDIP